MNLQIVVKFTNQVKAAARQNKLTFASNICKVCQDLPDILHFCL